MAKQGQNVWYELMTTDVESAKRFYGETIGWSTESWDEAPADKPYTMWKAGENYIGGVMTLPEEAKKMGAPPHWIAYTQVDDVDATTAKAKELGGDVHAPPFDIPKVGRIAILADPQGASFAVFKPENDSPPPTKSVGTFSWAELNTTDYEAAWKFYSKLFGWVEKSTMDMGEMGKYFMFNDPDEATQGGMSNMAKKMNMPAHWLHYITVENMDETVERIKKQGGTVVNGPMPIPGDDVIAQCKDPQGVFFAIYAEGKKG